MLDLTQKSPFVSTRQPAYNEEALILRDDLVQAANNNRLLWKYNLPTKRYHFHVINSHDIAVTVILTRLNCLMVRGKYCKDFQAVYEMIEKQKV